MMCVQMAQLTPPNLVENSSNLPVAVKDEHWSTSSTGEKFICLVVNCKSKGYAHKNHFRKHMKSHGFHLSWDTTGRPKGATTKPRIQNYRKYNALVLSDEMARKQKEFKQNEKKWFRDANQAWESLTKMDVPYMDKEKPILALLLDAVLEKYLGIPSWGQHIAPSMFNKLITDTHFAEYVRSTRGIKGIRSLKQCWAISTWEECEQAREEHVMEVLRWNKKIEHTKL